VPDRDSPRCQSPDADGDPLADGVGDAKRRVLLLGDGGAERVAEHGEGGAEVISLLLDPSTTLV